MRRRAPYVKALSNPRFHLFLLLSLVSFIPACSHEEMSDEVLRDDEAEQAEATRQSFQRLIEKYKTTYVARGAHAKGHACLRAYFDVNSDIEPAYRYGVFSEPGKRYRSWVRLSNGHFDLNASHDGKDDARGMAVKLMEIAAEPLEQSDVNTATQDFLMTNTAVFFVRNMPDYNHFIASPEQFMAFFFPGWNPFSWRIKEFLAAKKTLLPPPDSLLDPAYFSITPYKLGPHNIKFGARPCQMTPTKEPIADEKTGPDFLRKQLEEELAEADACFIFQVQRQVPGKGMSLDDATRQWRDKDSPFVPLARITIPAQDFMSAAQRQFCEHLSFAPWHALPAHRPLGQLNRLRRHAYAASSTYRHLQNQSVIPDALDFWCRDDDFDC